MPIVYFFDVADRGQTCEHTTHGTTGRGTASVSYDGTRYCARDLFGQTGYKAWTWDAGELAKRAERIFDEKGFVLGPVSVEWPTDVDEYSVPVPLSQVTPQDISPPSAEFDFLASYTSDTGDHRFFTVRFRGTDLRGAGVGEAIDLLNRDVAETLSETIDGVVVGEPDVCWRRV